MTEDPAFARDDATARYYDQRAGEYDDWYTGEGLFEPRQRPGWHHEVDVLVDLVRALSPTRTLDVACGTGFLTRHLRGFVVALDQSPAMVALTRSRLSEGVVLRGDGLGLPFADGTFDRVFTSHFYGHLPPEERQTFLSQARRVGRELVVVDTARRPGVAAEEWQERVLGDGSHHRVFKRFLTGPQLATEIGGEVLLEGSWFVAARADL